MKEEDDASRMENNNHNNNSNEVIGMVKLKTKLNLFKILWVALVTLVMLVKSIVFPFPISSIFFSFFNFSNFFSTFRNEWRNT